jgi:hypothetical protein
MQPPACVPGFLNLCELTAVDSDFSVTNAQIDTDADNRCQTLKQTDGPDVCLFYFKNINVQAGGTLLALGARPFALVAKDQLTIAGVLDVSSQRGRLGQPGAGSAPTATGLCSSVSPPVVATGGGGGGAGGTLMTAGGKGGIGNTDNSAGGPANAAGGVPGLAQTEPTFLRGGCNGQAGANGQTPPAGLLGQGGGAVYLSAATLVITGNVLAGGSGGGGGGGIDDGGGGGGSGGVIVAQSPSLRVSGMLLATGGGGGKGKGGGGGPGGESGADAITPSAAKGGQQGNGGGHGGDGSTSAGGGAGQDNVGGAGGGGGGSGLILLLGPQINTASSTIVPAETKRAE